MDWFLSLGDSQTCTNFPENCKCSCVGYRGKDSIIPSIQRPIRNFQYSFQLTEVLHSTSLWHFQVLSWVYFLENEVVSQHMFASIVTINWFSLTSLVVQTVKNLPAMWETWVWSLDWEDTLEKGMDPLQYYGLENSMDKGAWQATVRGIAESQIRLRDSHFSFLTWTFWKQFLCNAWGVDFSCNLINSHVNAKFCWGRRNYV